MARPAWLDRVKTQVKRHATTLGDVVGGALVSAGIWLIYSPAGVIAAGAFVLVASWSAAGRKDAT